MKKSLLIVSMFGFFVAANAQSTSQEVTEKKELNQEIKTVEIQKTKTELPNRAAQLKAMPVQKSSARSAPQVISNPKTEKINAVRKQDVTVIEQKDATTK